MKIISLNGLNKYHEKIKGLLNTFTTHEKGTWSPHIVGEGSFAFQPYRNAHYLKIGPLCLLTVDLYLLFDSDSYPSTERTNFEEYEYVAQDMLTELANAGYTFSKAHLSTGEWFGRTIRFFEDGFPFRLKNLINGSANSLGKTTTLEMLLKVMNLIIIINILLLQKRFIAVIDIHFFMAFMDLR